MTEYFEEMSYLSCNPKGSLRDREETTAGCLKFKTFTVWEVIHS